MATLKESFDEATIRGRMIAKEEMDTPSPNANTPRRSTRLRARRSTSRGERLTTSSPRRGTARASATPKRSRSPSISLPLSRERLPGPDPTTHWCDYRVVAWLIENIVVWSLAHLSVLLVPFPEEKDFFGVLFATVGGGLVVVEAAIVIQHFLVEVVYSHIPFFAGEHRPLIQPATCVLDWFRCNLPANIIASLVMVSRMCWAHDGDVMFNKLTTVRSVNIPLTCVKLLIGRVVVDVTFYGVHRALHHPLIYPLHKRHHEHVKTNLSSNVHFGVLDLILEGFVPIYAALLVLDACGLPNNRLETVLLLAQFEWYQIASHSGKSVPTVTWFPPLSLFYNAVWPVDKENVWFHERHHNLLRCNYGISQWCDVVMGTARY